MKDFYNWERDSERDLSFCSGERGKGEGAKSGVYLLALLFGERGSCEALGYWMRNVISEVGISLRRKRKEREEFVNASAVECECLLFNPFWVLFDSDSLLYCASMSTVVPT